AIACTRIHSPRVFSSNSTNSLLLAPTESFFNSFQLPLPFSSISSKKSVVEELLLWIHAERFFHPSNRNGSENSPSFTLSLSHTAPDAVAGPSLSGISSGVNHKFEFD